MQIVKKAWFPVMEKGNETLTNGTREKIGVAITHNCTASEDLEARSSSGAKHESVTRKVAPLTTLDSDITTPEYRHI